MAKRMTKAASKPPAIERPSSRGPGEPGFASWAVVEVMGHNEYAGFVTAEVIAGAPLLRVDVPATSRLEAFTKYLSMSAIFGISPCTEETARARCETKRAQPFDSWSVERQLLIDLKSRGLLLEGRQLESRLRASPSRGGNFDDDEPDEDD